MHDLARRALDSAARLGASYADVRVVRRREQHAGVKAGLVDALSLGETEGFGVRVLVDGAWGFASSGRMDGHAADEVTALAVRIARASARHARVPVRLADRPPASGHYETPVVEDPFEVPIDRTIDLLLAAERAMAAVRGVATTKADYHAFREWKDVRGHGWLVRRAGHHPRGRRAGGAGGQRGRPAATHLPRVGRLPGGRLRARPLARSRGAGPDAGRGGRGPACGARAAAGTPHHRAAPVAAVPADPRVLRPPHRARPRLRHGGGLRRHQLPDHRQAGIGLPLWLGPGDHRGRRHDARGPGHLRLGRRGRRGPACPARPARASSAATSAAGRRLPASAGPAAARCGPTAGTACPSSA